MSNGIKVKKRDGRLEPLHLEKMHLMVEEACMGLSGVSASQVEMTSGIQFYDGITTAEIQEILIKSAADLISLEAPNYQFVAARLLLFAIRKQIYGGRIEMPHLEEHINRCVSLSVYDSDIYNYYSKEEIDKANSFIDHERDYLFTYAGLRQVVDKYLVQDRSDKTVYETPQFMYIMIALTGFAKYPKETRMSYVKRYYDAISKHKINIPTPIMAGVRTPLRQYASCTLLDCGDSLESIIATDSAMMRYIAGRAGIGLNVGRLRAIGSKIRNGEVVSTGLIPFLKKFQATLESCHQGGIRKASMTCYVPIWHYEIEDVLVLKNNKGNDENRVRNIDYGIVFSRLFYERYLKKGNVTLFSPNDVPGLYEAFGTDNFDELYVQYENTPNIRKKVVNAQELFIAFLNERKDTGRYYPINIDHMNSHSSFKDKVEMSNLCVAPETKILTSDGYQVIEDLENEFVDIWNGESWSNVQVKKTSECQELIKVTVGSEEIYCTEYHKFYVVENKLAYYRKGEYQLKRAMELKPGDKLIKFDLPVISGEKKLEDAYTLGFHTGDGSYLDGKPILDLYGDKKNVLEHLNYKSANSYDNQDRIRTYLNIPHNTKFVVPDASYEIDSRLEWFAGLVDSDGHIARNGDTETIQICSINLNFLKETKLMLQTLGVDSKIKLNCDERVTMLPDGRGGQKEYNCKKLWRLLISSNGLAKLCNLGFGNFLKRKTIGDSVPNRNAERFHVVESIEYTGRKDATYCFTEPQKGMGMFNGYLLGNCVEITLPTLPLEHIDDEAGEIALCILSSINVGIVKNDKELEILCDLSVRFLDELIDYQSYPVKAAEISTKARRSLGIGVQGLAHYLAKLGFNYEQKEACSAVHGLSESLQYYLLKASNELAKEKGHCEYFGRTKYSDGILPIDTYKKDVDDICNDTLQHDWEELRKNILKYGLRHSTLSAQMPGESSSLSINATNSIEPPRGYMSIKRRIKQIVPQFSSLKNHYTLLWDMKSNEGYLNIVAVMQKFFDQSISANWSYNPENYEDNKVPMSVIMNDMLMSFKKGLKTSYYLNTYDGKKDDLELENLVDSILEEEEDCEACK